MKIILVTPYIANIYDSGKLVAKALSELGHHLILWDPHVSSGVPSQDYDLAFVLKGLDVEVGKLKRPRVNWYPDYITHFPREAGFKERVITVINEFDYFFTMAKAEVGIWLPGACDLSIHHSFSMQKQFDVVFMGTAHSTKRVKFIKQFIKGFDGKFGLFGNDWHKYGIKAYPPQYFNAFTQVINSAKIALNVHGDMFGVGLNRKIHEIAGCGAAMLLTDNVDGLEETYPMAPKFNSLEECLELTNYYLNNLRERRKLVKKIQKRAYEKFTYKHQVEKILKIVEEGFL